MSWEEFNQTVTAEEEYRYQCLLDAAPDLLKSLQMCLIALEMAGVGDSIICKDARIAIAKATGDFK